MSVPYLHVLRAGSICVLLVMGIAACGNTEQTLRPAEANCDPLDASSGTACPTLEGGQIFGGAHDGWICQCVDAGWLCRTHP